MFRTLVNARSAFNRAQTSVIRASKNAHVRMYVGDTAVIGFFGMMGYELGRQKIRTFKQVCDVVLVSAGAGLIAPIALPFVCLNVLWYGPEECFFERKPPTQ